jgi:hypothetical protein
LWNDAGDLVVSEAMNWEMLKARLLLRRGERTGTFILPSVVLDMQPGFVAGARMDRSSRQVRRVAVRQLEAGALEPLPSRPNLAKREVVRRAIREVLETVGNGGGRLGILLPDPSVRVAILRFETLPHHREEAEALVRWKMGGILPFPPEEARVSYQLLSKGDQPVELLAMAVRNSVMAEYEAAFETVSSGPALVLPATAALLPLLPAGGQGGQVLVHVCSGSVTTVVTAGDGISFWRNRLLEGHTAEGDREVVREIARVVATCRDHLKSEIEDLWIYVRPPATRSLDKEIGEATGRHVHLLDSSASHAAVLPPAEKKILEGFGLTFAGLLENHN